LLGGGAGKYGEAEYGWYMSAPVPTEAATGLLLALWHELEPVV
jgi:hypothetical protein